MVFNNNKKNQQILLNSKELNEDDVLNNIKNKTAKLLSKKKQQQKINHTIYELKFLGFRLIGVIIIFLGILILLGCMVAVVIFFIHLLGSDKIKWLDQTSIDRLQIISITIVVSFIVNLASQISYKYFNKDQ